MSSILDALKKLEAEKAEARKPPEQIVADDVAERELVGREPLRERLTIKLTPATLIIGGLVFGLILVIVSVGISLALVKPSGDSVARMNVAPSSQAHVAKAADTDPNSKEDDTAGDRRVAAGKQTSSAGARVDSDEEKPADYRTEPVAAGQPRQSDQSQEEKAGSRNEGWSVASLPVASSNVKKPSLAKQETHAETMPDTKGAVDSPPAPADATEPREVEIPGPRLVNGPKPATSSEGAGAVHDFAEQELEVDPRTLPRLRESHCERMGIRELQINMLQPKSKTRPYPSAIINLNKVYVGERIPRTSARLIAVDGLNGIAIEIESTKKRYYVPFGFRPL